MSMKLYCVLLVCCSIALQDTPINQLKNFNGNIRGDHIRIPRSISFQSLRILRKSGNAMLLRGGEPEEAPNSTFYAQTPLSYMYETEADLNEPVCWAFVLRSNATHVF
jgi:hypothetical protein